ncbi:MAG: biotin--[acetyl-CoA-carboxylase] ligase [Actinomycetaceae bacterium]|nr:biotin--[acetyl-CoA-carboxylase] ligase [Actinomycetaceae bacterium]
MTEPRAEDVGRALFELTGRNAPVVLHTELTASTQDDLAELWEAGSVPAGTVMIADDQTAGRGRVGRTWHSRPGKSLLASVLLELPESVADHLAWVTLAGACAALESVRAQAAAHAQHAVALSWPNDIVSVDGESGPRKLGGLLGEVCGRRDGKIAVVLGWGLNLSLTEDELPTPVSASLLSAGLTVPDRDGLVAGWLAGLTSRLDALVEAGDPEAAGLVREVNTVTETLRPGITVGRPRQAPITGSGLRILADASLEIATDDGIQVVTSGEVSLLGMSPRMEGEPR